MFGSHNTALGVVALFSASDDTDDLVRNILLKSGDGQRLILCHFSDLKKGVTDFEKYLDVHNPEVVIIEIAPPYEENWAFLKTIRDSPLMITRGFVLITPNKHELEQVLVLNNEDSGAFEVLGEDWDRDSIYAAIKLETAKATAARRAVVVALFNSNDDTVEMVGRMLESRRSYRLAACHFSDLKKGNIDFAAYLAAQNPAVVIFDITAPYEENWEFFQQMRTSKAMEGRAVVLTTTNKARLDEFLGKDSGAMQIVDKPYSLQQITDAIEAACGQAASSQIDAAVIAVAALTDDATH